MKKRFLILLLIPLSFSCIQTERSKEQETISKSQVKSSLSKYIARKSPHLRHYDEVQLDSLILSSNTPLSGNVHLLCFSNGIIGQLKTTLIVQYELSKEFLNQPYKIKPIKWSVIDTLSNTQTTY